MKIKHGLNICFPALALLFAPPIAAETYDLLSHNIITDSGITVSQARGDFRARGTLRMEDGCLELEMETVFADGTRYPAAVSGTYTVAPDGVTVTVHYGNGVSHSGLVLHADPLVTFTQADGINEVNIWKRVNGFVENE